MIVVNKTDVHRNLEKYQVYIILSTSMTRHISMLGTVKMGKSKNKIGIIIVSHQVNIDEVEDNINGVETRCTHSILSCE